MENLNDLQAIWQSAPLHGLPSSEEMVGIIKRDRRQKLKKLSLIIGLAILLIVTMLGIAIFSPPSTLITKTGVALLTLAGILMGATNLNSLNRFYKLDVCSNKDYISFLNQTKLRQLFYFKRTQPLVMSLAVTGLFLYWYELAVQHPIIGIGIYAVSSIYFLILWCYVRPKIFKREQDKLIKSIANINRISKQF